MKPLLLPTLLLALVSPLCAQETSVPMPPLAQVTGDEVAGLNVEYVSGGKSDFRPSRLAALYVTAGQAPTPFLPVGPFTARMEGSLQSPLRAEVTLAADLAGTVRVLVNGSKVVEGTQAKGQRLEGGKVKLNKGANKIQIEYSSPPQGDACFRLIWASSEFFPEPVPPTVFMRDAATPEIRNGDRIREGRLLFAQHRCVACHEAADLLPAKGEGMPELSHDAPTFAEFGARFKENWLAHWINNPHAIRPQTLMPRVFTGEGETVDQRAADLAAFLMSLGTPGTQNAPREEDVPLGGALFANLGCIACHTQPDYDGSDEFKRVPLGHLQAKWQPAALTDYLKDPQKYYQWTRMPNFRLSQEEASQLTAYLLSGTQKEYAPAPKGDAAKGGQLAATAGCLNCHAGLPPTTAPKLAQTLQSNWERGCVAQDSSGRGQAPDFAFGPTDLEALRAFAATGFASLKQDAPAEFSHRQSKNLRCNACHAMDASPSVWSQLEGDMAALTSGAPAPEGEGAPIGGPTAPPFAFFGEKLKTAWASDFIAGKQGPKPRPWIIARMPGFPTHASGMAAGLAHEHGFSTEYPAMTKVDPEFAKAGEQLLGENGGFNCMTCHGVGDRGATAVFEAPGINLALAPARLRAEYYHRWVLFPQRIDPDTKMPKFADDAGHTPLTDFFEGDAHKQYEAIWQYLHTQVK